MANNPWFSWLIPGTIAGVSCPGRINDLQQDLQVLTENGVGGLVSLTETRIPSKILEQFGLSYLHLAIPDYTAPTVDQIRIFMAFVKEIQVQKKGVAVHCQAGLGRTGTMLTAFLMSAGHPLEFALETVREYRPGSVETSEQENVLVKWGTLLNKKDEWFF